jgi:hypothetical protein
MSSEAIYQDDYWYLTRSARDRCINILRGGWSKLVYFTFAGVTIQPGDFETVATALEQNKIMVEIDYNYWSLGEYRSANKTIHGQAISGKLVLGSGTSLLSYTTQQALLVHEAVHAAMDLKSKSSMTVLVSECLAYIVQQMFHKMTTAEFIKGGRKFDVSAILADKYMHGGTPKDETLAALAEALASDPDYGVKALSAKAQFNG